MRKILDSLMIHPKSMHDVAKETSIPNTTAYRKIKWLLEEGLLTVASIQITEEGKKTSLFRSTLRSFSIEYVNGEMTIKADKNIEVLEKTAETFFSLDA